MNIGIIIGRIGDVDGVALETEKWIHVLEKNLGHDVYILSGRFRKNAVDPARQTLIRNMSFFSPNAEWEQNRAFFFPPDSPGELLAHLVAASDDLAMRMFKWIMVNKIDLVIVQNASAIPLHLSMGIAIRKLAERSNIKILCHDHDFYWERGERYQSPFPKVQEMLERSFPLRVPNAIHAVINTHNKDLIKERFDIDSTLVPNVMDFNENFGQLDDYNKDLPEAIGLKPGDIPIFQVTRIVRRKNIECAIELIERMGDPRIKLVITGGAADDERKGYYKELLEDIEKRDVKDQVIFAEKRILNDRGTHKDGEKIYSLSDAYAHAAATTYFSSYEGFGNAFVESVLAKTPIFVNNYKPVYWPDIGSKGFRAPMIEDNVLTDEAVAEMKEIILNPALQKEIGEHNFKLGQEHFSYEVLERLLKGLIGQLQ